MGKIISKFMMCCLARDDDDDEIDVDVVEEKYEENLEYNFDYLDTLENGTAIKYYILKNMYKEHSVEYTPSVQYYM